MKHRRVVSIACGKYFWSNTADVARPSALREASCERCAPVIARLFLSLVLQPLPPGDAERRVPDRETVRPNLERTDSPALLPSGFRFSPEQPGFGAFPLISRGGRPPSGLLSLAEPAYAPRPSPAATTVLITGFRQRSARLFRRLSRLVAGTAGGPCVGDPVLPRSLPYSIQFFCSVFERLRRPFPTRRFFWSLRRTVVFRSVYLLLYYICCVNAS